MPAETLVHLLRDNYTESKVRGKKSFLLERQQLYSLAEFRSQTEILGFLADSPYGPELSKLQDNASPVEIETAIRLGFARAVRNLLDTAKGNVKQFLTEYCRRFDAYDLATLVLYKSQGKSWEEYVGTRQPLSLTRESQLRRLYAIESLDSLAEAIGDDELQSRLEGVSLDALTTDKASLIRDIFNGWGEERFYKFINTKLHGRDRESCRSIVGSSLDMLNLSVTIRSKLIGLTAVKQHLVPIYWKPTQRQIDQILAAEDVATALDRASAIPAYRNALSGARQRFEEAGSLSFIEGIARRQVTEIARKVLLGFPYTIGVVLAFLILKENEASNLAAVASGVGAGLKSEQIRALVSV